MTLMGFEPATAGTKARHANHFATNTMSKYSDFDLDMAMTEGKMLSEIIPTHSFPTNFICLES